MLDAISSCASGSFRTCRTSSCCMLISLLAEPIAASLEDRRHPGTQPREHYGTLSPREAVNTSPMVELPHRAARGLDRHGFILPEVSLDRVRPPYPQVITVLRERCGVAFSSSLHSLYLTGSVVKGTARLGQSDFDVLAVLEGAPTPEHEESARQVAAAVAGIFPFITEVSIVLASRGAILSEEERDDMGFFVKILCACVAGEDLGEH